MDATIPATQNPEWGFYGTMRHRVAADTAWNAALPAIVAATRCSPDEVRAFLDSRHGRHFADEVVMHMPADGSGIGAAIDAAVARWMGWTITANISRLTDIPVGLPYLTGFVVHASIEDEANG